MNIKLRLEHDLINIHAAACAQRSDWSARASTERMRREQRILCEVRRGLALRASLDFKSGRHLASPHQHLQRENSWNTREHPVLVSDCLRTDDVMFIHTHIRARWILIIPIDPMHLRCSNFIELRFELSLSCTGCALWERDLTLLTDIMCHVGIYVYIWSCELMMMMMMMKLLHRAFVADCVFVQVLMCVIICTECFGPICHDQTATSVHALHHDVIAGFGQTSKIFTFNTMLHFQFYG